MGGHRRFRPGALRRGLRIRISCPRRHSAVPDTAAVYPAAPAASTNLYAAPAPEVRADLDFVGISEKVGPAVVKIVSEHKEKARQQQGFEDQLPFDDFWDRFFGRPAPGQRQPQDYRSVVQGTGFFISADGYILTNNHIVEDSVKNTGHDPPGEGIRGQGHRDSTPRPTWPSSRSRPRTCPSPSWAIPPWSRSASGSWPSATRWAWSTP